LFETRAAIGTAETPAEPISGLIGSLHSLFISRPIRQPPAVPKLKAISPSTRMPSVSELRNFSQANLEPTDSPSMIVTTLINAFDMVSANRATFGPTSRHRLPSISAPISGTALGSSSEQSSNTVSGKQTFSIFETGRSCFITILRSRSGTIAFMIGG